MNISNILTELKSDNSRLAKEAILLREKNNETLKRVFKMAYDPTINFWVRKIPAYNTEEFPGYSLDEALDELGRLSSREFTGLAASQHLSAILSKVLLEQEVIKKIISRDLDVGATVATANKIWPGLIPEYPYMRCNLPKNVKLNKWKWDKGIISQLKADGSYANVEFCDDVTIMTRAGSVYPLEYFANIVADIKAHFKNNTATHGELLVKRFGKILPREIGNGILNSIQKGGAPEEGDEIVYFVWDQIPLDKSVPGGVYDVKYADRLAAVRSQVLECTHIKQIETRLVYSLEEAYDHYNEMIEQGFEGTIIKTLEGIWKDSTSKDQVKLKVEETIDLEVIGFLPGKGKFLNLFGSIMCKSADGALEVNVSGMSDKMRKEIWQQKETFVGTIIEVKANGVMKPKNTNDKYSLFLPRFVCIRNDKQSADNLEKIISIFP